MGGATEPCTIRPDLRCAGTRLLVAGTTGWIRYMNDELDGATMEYRSQLNLSYVQSLHCKYLA